MQIHPSEYTLAVSGRVCSVIALALMAVLLSGNSWSADSAHAPCDTPQHHQFDFWVGDWQVFDARTNQLVAFDRVEKHSQGCIVQQNLTVGLSSMTKLAPPRYVSQVMGVWFLALALGNNLAGQLSRQYDAANLESLPALFLKIFWWTAGAAILMYCLSPRLERLIKGPGHEAHEGTIRARRH